MRAITALERDEKSGAVRVYVDGVSFGVIAAADVAALGVRVGGGAGDALLAALERRAEAWSARVVALRILSFRALPSAEIRRRLVRKGHAPWAADEAVAALVAARLIDDGEFARHYAKTRARRFRYGPARLSRDLQRLGIEREAADAAVAAALDEDGVDPGVLLREAAAKKLRSLNGLEPALRRRRLKIYLLRRGFPVRDVIEVVKEALAG